MRIAKFILGFTAALALLLVTFLYPQTAQSEIAPSSVYPQAYVKNLSLAKENLKAGETVAGSFILENRSNFIASDVYYAILLAGDYQANGIPKVIYDDKSQFGPITLGPLEKRRIQFSYTLPTGIAGDNLGIRVQAFLGSGAKLGWKDLLIKAEGEMSAIQIVSAAIVANGVKFGPERGPTIKEGQKVQYSITLNNPSSKQITLTPNIAIYNRTTTGVPLATSTDKKITLAAKQKKEFIFDLPTFDYEPLVYAGRIEFADASTTIRAFGTFRYIIGGDIATILSMATDKPSPKAEGIFNVSVFYAGSPADIKTHEAYNVGNADLSVKVFNEKNEVVAEAKETISLVAGKMKSPKVFALTAGVSARTLRAEAVITKGDKVLSSFTAVLSTEEIFAAGQKAKSRLYALCGIIALLAVLGVVFAVLLGRKLISKIRFNSRRYFNVVVLILGIAAFVGLTFGAYSVFGYDETYRTDDNQALPHITIINTPDVLSPGEEFYVTGQISALEAENQMNDVMIYATYNGDTPEQGWSPEYDPNATENSVTSWPANEFSLGPFTAPNNGGGYYDPNSYPDDFKVDISVVQSGSVSGDVNGFQPFSVEYTFEYEISGSYYNNYHIEDITVDPGSSGSTNIYLTSSQGTPDYIDLWLSGLPDGATASFDPEACIPDPECIQTLTIETSESTLSGSYPITVIGYCSTEWTYCGTGEYNDFTLTVNEIPGAVRIDHQGLNPYLSGNPNGAYSYVDDQSTNRNNPTIYTNISAGSHTAYVTQGRWFDVDISNAIKVGTCTNPIGGTLCAPASYSDAVCVNDVRDNTYNALCNKSVTVSKGVQTRVVFINPATVTIEIKGDTNGFGPALYLDSLPGWGGTNFSIFNNITSGAHTAATYMTPSNWYTYTITAGSCTYALGDLDYCKPTTFSPVSPADCPSGTSCAHGITVAPGSLNYVLFRYAPPSGVETAKIFASKIVCKSEEDLPNWSGSGTPIGATTAQDYVDSHPESPGSDSGCHLQDNAQFQWGYNEALPLDGDFTGEATETGNGAAQWKTSDPTNYLGVVEMDIPALNGTSQLRVREVLTEDYIPFTVDTDIPEGAQDDVSAEMWCNGDVENYDNYDGIWMPVSGGEYYCIAFNVVKPPPPPPATIIAYSVTCPSESVLGSEDLPNWSFNPAITIGPNTASSFIDFHPTCYLQNGTQFQWGYNDVKPLPGDKTGLADGSAGAGTNTGTGNSEWKTSGSTGVGTGNGLGYVQISIPDPTLNGTSQQIRVREVLTADNVPFTVWKADEETGPQDDVSAEMWCDSDVENYDNYDGVYGPVSGNTYYCITFNAPKPDVPVVTAVKIERSGSNDPGNTQAKVDSLTASSSDPAIYSGLSVGAHTAYATAVAGTVKASYCTYLPPNQSTCILPTTPTNVTESCSISTAAGTVDLDPDGDGSEIWTPTGGSFSTAWQTIGKGWRQGTAKPSGFFNSWAAGGVTYDSNTIETTFGNTSRTDNASKIEVWPWMDGGTYDENLDDPYSAYYQLGNPYEYQSPYSEYDGYHVSDYEIAIWNGQTWLTHMEGDFSDGVAPDPWIGSFTQEQINGLRVRIRILDDNQYIYLYNLTVKVTYDGVSGTGFCSLPIEVVDEGHTRVQFIYGDAPVVEPQIFCAASPAYTSIGKEVKWTAWVHPAGTYTYTWTPSVGNPVTTSDPFNTATYTNEGTVNMNVEALGVTNTCSTSVKINPPPVYREF